MLSKKIKTLKPSATQALAAKAKEFQTLGRDVVNLSLGQPSWECFEESKKQAAKSIQKGCSHYAPAAGLPELREAIAEDLNQHLKLDFETQNITVSVGAKHCLFSALQALVDPEDEVIIPSPYWVSYPSMVRLVGAKAVIVSGDSVSKKLSPSILEKYVNPKTKILILNSPNNPTGLVYSLEELEKLAQVISKFKRLFVLSDDIYNRMYLDSSPGSYAPHILEASPELKERTIIVNAASKNYAMPGWRLGWAAANPEIIKAMNAFQSQTVSSAPTLSQMTMIQTIKNCTPDIKKTHALLIQKREKMASALKDLKELSFDEPQGALYLWLNIQKLLGKHYKNQKIQSSMDAAQILADEEALFTVPGEAFGCPGYLRLYFATSDSNIKKCKKRFETFISQLKN